MENDPKVDLCFSIRGKTIPVDHGFDLYSCISRSKDLVLEIARSLVASPEQVSVSEIGGGNTVVYELKVAKSDIGKVIGKQGKNINAIRTLLGAIAGKTHIRMMLEIIE